MALGVGALGCLPAADVEPSACKNPLPAVAELGEGDKATGFKPLVDGGKMVVILGPQGMYMLTVSLKLKNFEKPAVNAANSEISIAMWHNGEVLGGIETSTVPLEVGDNTIAFLGIQPVFNQDKATELFDSGKLAEVTATVKDGCGRSITGKRQVKFAK